MGLTNEGINAALNAIFPTTPNLWYVGLINNNPIPVLSSLDTLVSHSGWTEVVGGGVGYTGNRKTWTNGTASSQVVTNATFVSFAITASMSVYGIMLCSVALGNAGTLFGTTPFVGGAQGVVNTDTLQVTLTVSGASG